MIHNSKIFLDGGDPNETKEIITLLGKLDGQTTNPTLIAKNPEAQKRLAEGKKFTQKEIYDFYRTVVTELSGLLPKGSVSIEVYADRNTTADQMFAQAKEMWSWIPNAHIKYPTTTAGLLAAERSIQAGMWVNLTLVFTQEQAAAVHSATRGAKKGDVFVSPFVGRLDDIGENGMDLIKNIRTMYDQVESHVEILSASIRSADHFLASLAYGADIITAPGKAIREWISSLPPQSSLEREVLPSSATEGVKKSGIQGVVGVPEGFTYNATELKPIAYKKLNLLKNWRTFDISHPLTDKGIERFASDWNALIQ